MSRIDVGTMDAVRLSGLTRSFGAVRAVDGIDLVIPRGQTMALLGPNGAGKSTTIDLLLGLSTPDSGQVSIFGEHPADAVVAGRLGVMLQVGQVIRDLSVRELLTMMASLFPSPLAVPDVLELAGLESIADRRTNKLSGGETQKVRFALALVSDPELLVLDEPTVAMDIEARQAFWATMRTFTGRGRTVVFATHYLEEADAYADRIVLLARGKVVADGPTGEVKALVSSRTLRTTLQGADQAELSTLPGVHQVEVRGASVTMHCSDSDAALRALVARYGEAHDIEVSGAGLSEAFLSLTRDDAQDRTSGEPAGVVR